MSAQEMKPAEGGEPLRTKYYCQVNGTENVEIVMMLSAFNVAHEQHIPMRYVLVIDVSGSMGLRSGNSTATLLQRIKIFADLAVDNLTSDDSLSIVTFSDSSEIILPLTAMDKHGKIKAKSIIEGLYTIGGTNLKGCDLKTRDMIMIFTDGLANKGETDPEVLVEMYLNAQNSTNRQSCVPLAAFTIGRYAPTLLNELSKQLGSDAFYWLNEEEEFEADMLIPMILRNATQVTDVRIKLECRSGAAFSENDEKSNTLLRYFIHSIPDLSRRTISFTVLISKDLLRTSREERVADIEITYLDASMNIQIINDIIMLSRETLSIGDVQHNTSAFTLIERQIHVEKEEIYCAFLVVAEEKYRKLCISGMQKYTEAQDIFTGGLVIETAITSIKETKQRYSEILEVLSFSNRQINESAGEWIEKLRFGNTLSTRDYSGRLFAILSSIEKERPATKRVFGPGMNQTKIPIYVSEKVAKNEQDVREIKKSAKIETKTFENTVNLKQQTETTNIDSTVESAETTIETTKSVKQTFETTPVFETMNILVSETLRKKKVGVRQETMSELITRCGGKSVTNVNSGSNNTLLACSSTDYKQNTVLVRDCKRAKIPIVRPQFIFDCIQEKIVVEVKETYLFYPKKMEDIKVERELEKFGTVNVFKEQNVILSESLRGTQVGVKKESFQSLISRCGGRPEFLVIVNPYENIPKWYEPKSFTNHFLVCSDEDCRMNSFSVRNAKMAKIPIVKTEFIFDCIRKREFLKMEKYSV